MDLPWGKLMSISETPMVSLWLWSTDGGFFHIYVSLEGKQPSWREKVQASWGYHGDLWDTIISHVLVRALAVWTTSFFFFLPPSKKVFPARASTGSLQVLVKYDGGILGQSQWMGVNGGVTIGNGDLFGYHKGIMGYNFPRIWKWWWTSWFGDLGGSFHWASLADLADPTDQSIISHKYGGLKKEV